MTVLPPAAALPHRGQQDPAEGSSHPGPAMSVRGWVEEGALIAAGSDCNVSFFDPLLSIWGLVTRGTRTAGVHGGVATDAAALRAGLKQMFEPPTVWA